ncbi:tetratricopeptide repeat protein [Bradyrhizobium sp. ISRA442]|uniref:tetratricopeptide repeat protein n=1 Tax=Bradyrhizobium sp. ISRA442 TaxID=2866197 RepID=UPI00311ADED7
MAPGRTLLDRRWGIIALISVVLIVGGAVFWLSVAGSSFDQTAAKAPPAVANYVGSQSCAVCHPTETGLWQQSQHKLAMAHATEATVLGDFNGVTFEHFGVRSRFFRKDGKFFVETDGPDGNLAEYEIKYTFGVDPLQQYLIEFPDGRLQALSIAWDARAKEKGGQRWFHLYPNEKIDHTDPLHWTRLNQNWNFMCSECHSTGVRKNYDASKDRFNTTWAEISVGCETCHGQGSNHVAWAASQQKLWPFGKSDSETMGLLVRFSERLNASWSLEKASSTASRNPPPATLRTEVETCGLCHARRSQISEDWIPGQWLSETHLVLPLSRGLYHADGQMLDEVYNYGSFKQSKMFAAGVTCSNCHDPHSGKTRLAGDGVCLQCHAPEKFAAVSHHHHAEANPPPACASCHMPVDTYMVVDSRHDHSFRVPRPDLSVQLGTPNACNDCHTDKTAEWAAAAIEKWHGPERKGFQTYGPAFHAAWADGTNPAALLAHIAGDQHNPGFARAGALAELNAYLSAETVKIASTALGDSDPMVRIGALDMLDGMPLQQLWPIAGKALADPVRGVRIRAVSLLAGLPASSQPPEYRAAYEKAVAEFTEAQRLNADRPEGRTNLGNLFAREGQLDRAEAEYVAALRLSGEYVPATINLADLYARQKREDRVEAVLRKSIEQVPRNAALHHALGLSLVRSRHQQDALEELRLASELQPAQARYAYVYAVALNSAGRVSDAIRQLEENVARHPSHRETLAALVTINQQAGDLPSALKYAEQLAKIIPDDPNITRLVKELREAAAKAPRPN